jgi:hypothetical protein
MEDEKSEKGFVIRDRRHFDESGEVRREAELPPQEPRPAAAAKEPPPPEQDGYDASRDLPEEDLEGYLPEVNFMNFILSLSTTVMFHFGDYPDPASGKAAKNLAAAKHVIDTIAMLKTKTEGNLDNNEKTLVDTVLFELRMRYVKESA